MECGVALGPAGLSVGQDVTEAQASVGAHHAGWQISGLDQTDHGGPRHTEGRCLFGREVLLGAAHPGALAFGRSFEGLG